MNKINESIFDGQSAIIPMEEVMFMEKHWIKGKFPIEKTKTNFDGLSIVMKSTKWNFEMDCWENPCYLSKDEADRFLIAWSRFRHEKEEINL